jgi:hypothetical protein
VAITDTEGINSHKVSSPQATTPVVSSPYPTKVCNAPTTWYDTLVGVLTLSDENTSLNEVKLRHDYEQWVQAMDAELASLLSNTTYSFNNLPFERHMR